MFQDLVLLCGSSPEDQTFLIFASLKSLHLYLPGQKNCLWFLMKVLTSRFLHHLHSNHSGRPLKSNPSFWFLYKIKLLTGLLLMWNSFWIHWFWFGKFVRTDWRFHLNRRTSTSQRLSERDVLFVCWNIQNSSLQELELCPQWFISAVRMMVMKNQKVTKFLFFWGGGDPKVTSVALW